jgi:hypothetical protein
MTVVFTTSGKLPGLNRLDRCHYGEIAQLLPLPSATASSRITTGEQPQPTLREIPGKVFAKRQSGTCSVVVTTTTVTIPGVTVTLSPPYTVYLTTTYTVPEPTLSGQGAVVSVSARDATPCSDCIQNRAEVTRHEARSPGHNVLEARQPFPPSNNTTACFFNITTTVILPGSTSTILPIITQIVAVPPKMLTSADSLDGTRKDFLGDTANVDWPI